MQNTIFVIVPCKDNFWDFSVIFLLKLFTLTVNMVVLTIVMLVMFLSLLPLRIAVSFRVDFAQKCLFVRSRLFFVPILSERVVLKGTKLVFCGTIDAETDILQMDGKRGIDIAKAPVFDSVSLTFALDYCRHSPYIMLATESFSALGTAVSCAFSNCRVHTQTMFSTVDSLFGEVKLSVSLAEILLVILKDTLKNSLS